MVDLADIKLMNGISDAQTLQERVPWHMDPVLQQIAEERTRDKEINTLGKMQSTLGWTRGRTMQRIASIPGPVLAMMQQIDPDIMHNKPKFLRWLKENPAYDLRGKVGA